jgi:hypothetical protein
VDEHREALLTQSIRDHASVLKTVHFNAVPALAIKPAKLRDKNLRPPDPKRIVDVGDPETQGELSTPSS